MVIIVRVLGISLEENIKYFYDHRHGEEIFLIQDKKHKPCKIDKSDYIKGNLKISVSNDTRSKVKSTMSLRKIFINTYLTGN